MWVKIINFKIIKIMQFEGYTVNCVSYVWDEE